MDSSTTAAAQWPQDIVVKPMEEIIATCPKPTGERKIRPQKDHALNCPRCNSTNTKFCYYNNYSLSQPRYFCKTCRRYWTEGGSLRNIPVGGGSRKNKRSSSSSSISSNSTSLASRKLPDLVPQQNPNLKTLENPRDDLNLGFPGSHHMIHLPSFDATKLDLQNTSTSSSSSNLDLLTTTTTASRGLGLNAFMPLMTTDLNYSTSGFTFNVHPLGGADQFKPSLNFSLDGLGSNFGNFQGVQEQNGKILFPFEDLKQVNNGRDEHGEENRENHQNGDSTGYWPW